jgi:hypothetical protein
MPDPAPIKPLPHLDRWTESLRQISSHPLEYCPNFPQIAQRFEAFWNNDLQDRPIFIAQINTNPERPITRRLDLLGDSERWLDAKLADFDQTHFVGDAVPFIRVDFGAVMLSGMLGGEPHIESDTTWTESFITDDWSNAPDWSIQADSAFWQQLQTLSKVAAEAARDRFLVMTPDLGGSGDVLLNLRGSGQLAMDTLDQPEHIEAALDGIYDAWHRGYNLLYDNIVGSGAGILHFLQLWSNQPYMIPACDFNALISPRAFKRLFLPDIRRQAATVGRAVFHLDGPDAARHAPALIDTPELDAIQYTPGSGTPSALAKVDMLRSMQDAGKPVVVFVPYDEVLELSQTLSPRGLAMIVEGAPDAATLDDLYRTFCAQFGTRN